MRFTQTCLVLGILATPALAAAQIRQPGAHQFYSAELEPHLVVAWNDFAPCSSDAFGPGFRATIPFLANGPIPKINNNMGIGFGLDFARAGIDSTCARYNFNGNYYGNGFSADIWTIPVVAQWNFFLLPKISVFGEAGLSFEHRRWDDGNFGGNCGNGQFCGFPATQNTVDPSFSVGGRFLVSDSVGFLLRLGFPYLSAGVSILM
jgi:hypothetical protein